MNYELLKAELDAYKSAIAKTRAMQPLDFPVELIGDESIDELSVKVAQVAPVVCDIIELDVQRQLGRREEKQTG